MGVLVTINKKPIRTITSLISVPSDPKTVEDNSFGIGLLKDSG